MLSWRLNPLPPEGRYTRPQRPGSDDRKGNAPLQSARPVDAINQFSSVCDAMACHTLSEIGFKIGLKFKINAAAFGQWPLRLSNSTHKHLPHQTQTQTIITLSINAPQNTTQNHGPKPRTKNVQQKIGTHRFSLSGAPPVRWGASPRRSTRSTPASGPRAATP